MQDREELLLNMRESMLEAFGSAVPKLHEDPWARLFDLLFESIKAKKAVDLALADLKVAGFFVLERLKVLGAEALFERLKPFAAKGIKSRQIKGILVFLQDYCEFEIDSLSSESTLDLRNLLLGIRGVGPTSADSMLLYVFDRPVFVVDSGTALILQRHLLIPEEDVLYAEIQDFFMDVLPAQTDFLRDYHRLIRLTAKKWCPPRQKKCTGCPLEKFLF